MSDLTPAQFEAVEHHDGPLLVLAGAGSGKTRVITHRVARLLERGVDPSAVLAITFTNKAAGEMQSRIGVLTHGARVWVSTFHSFCARMLRRYARWVDHTADFTIVDDSDQRVAIREALVETGTDPKLHSPAKIGYAIERLKDQLKTPAEANDEAQGAFEEAVARAYTYYQDLLEQSNAMDFNDLLVKTVRLLQQDEIRTILARRFEYLLIDEYQDTNHAQYMLANLLASEHRNICATGDPDQSIYGWRGADIGNILRFEQDYPEARVIALEENFRSTRLILDAANALIGHNTERREKDLVTSGEEGAPLEFQILNDQHEEARFVARRVQERLLDGVSPAEIGVFYRASALSRTLETAFLERNLRYRVVGSVAFYSRREVKDVLAYLRLLQNPKDDLAFQRVVNVPTRGVGKTTVNRLREYGQSCGCSLFDAGVALSKDKQLRGRGREGVRKFLSLIVRLRASAKTVTLEEAVRGVLAESAYRAHIKATAAHVGEETDRLENLEALIEGARDFDRRVGYQPALAPPAPEPAPEVAEDVPDAADLPLFAAVSVARGASRAGPSADGLEQEQGGIAGFLQHTALLSAAESGEDEHERVSMMTIHAAKGLEFDTVFLIGLEEGLFPHSRSLEDGGGLEEERRLAYVAITRAKRRLILTRANWRMVQGRTQPQRSSLFLAELPAEVFQASRAPLELDRAYAISAEPKDPWADTDGIDEPAWDDDAPPRPKAKQTKRVAARAKPWRQPLTGPGAPRPAPQRAAETARSLAAAALTAGGPSLLAGGDYAPGDRIYHEQFGRGKVVSLRGKPDNRYATIEFESYGKKTLSLHYARMRKLEDHE